MATYEPWKVGQLISSTRNEPTPLWSARQNTYYKDQMTGVMLCEDVGIVVETYVLGDLGKPDWIKIISSGGAVGWNRPWNFKVIS